jgi:MOSC domain-containing protein YiiM
MDESIARMREEGVRVSHGDFAENIVTRGLDLLSLSPGDTIRLGDHGRLEVTMIGKTCHAPCSIYHQVGYCIMPEEGVFCKVLEPGRIRIGDEVLLEKP